MNYEELYTLAERVEERLQPVFRGFERTAEKNTKKVLDAFRAHRVSEPCFAGTTGYGYDDLGRETLERVYADVFGAEARSCAQPLSTERTPLPARFTARFSRATRSLP